LSGTVVRRAPISPGARSVLVVTVAFFVALTLAVLLLEPLPLDANVREALLGMASPRVIEVMRVINLAGDWRMLLPGTVLLFVVFPRARRRWWMWVGLMLAAPLVETLLKSAVGRARPEDAAAFGFPSGHATAAAAFAGAVMYLAGGLPRRAALVVRLMAAVAIVLVGAARVILRAHWPSDVLGGIALGLGLASAAALLAFAAERPLDAKPARHREGAPTGTGL
jgi:membrane-associated phospholipid phosphatase